MTDYFNTNISGYQATGFTRGSLVYVPDTTPSPAAEAEINQFMVDRGLLSLPENGRIIAEWEMIAISKDAPLAYNAKLFVWLAEETANNTFAIVLVKAIMDSVTDQNETWGTLAWSAHAPVPPMQDNLQDWSDWALTANLDKLYSIRQYALDAITEASIWEDITF